VSGGNARRTLVAYTGFTRRPSVSDITTGACRLLDLDDVQLGRRLDEDHCGTVIVLARSATDLRRSTTVAAILPEAADIVVMVEDAPPDGRVPVPAPGPLWPALINLDVRRRHMGWSLRVRLVRPHPAGEVLATVARALGAGSRASILPSPAVGLTGVGATHWRPGDPGVMTISEGGPVPADLGPPAVDLVLRCVTRSSSAWGDPSVPAVDRVAAPASTWRRIRPRIAVRDLGDRDHLPPVDECLMNPMGFVATPRHGTGHIVPASSARWAVAIGSEVAAYFRPTGCVSDADVARLRDLRAIVVGWDGHLGPIAKARAVAGLAAAGVPLLAEQVPAWARRLLGESLAVLLESVSEKDLADDQFREEHSIRLRRCALRMHGVRARWRSLAGSAGLPVPLGPKVSVILCTRRPGRIGFALDQIARQRFQDFEVVLALHGIPASSNEVAAAMRGFDHPLTIVEIDSNVPFGIALNRAADKASGTHLAKMDDDDWYGPEHLADMMLAASYSGADLVGCAAEFVYLEEAGVTVRRRTETERPARHVAGGTMVVSRETFTAAGGFRPIRQSVDAYLLYSVLSNGGLIYRTHGLGYVLRRCATGHTWNESFHYFLRGASHQWHGFYSSALLEVAECWLPEPPRTPASSPVMGGSHG
jgi:hypothetical protein